MRDDCAERMIQIPRWMRAFCLCAALLAGCGCATHEPPSMRLGSLPFPGPFSLYAVADPSSLGGHQYEPDAGLLHDETSRGILYTCRAGFLDLSHVRDSIDLSRYFYLVLADAVRKGNHQTTARAFSPCRFHITIDLPASWEHGKEEDRLPSEVDDALIELSVQLSWIATTWYEILQWAGYSSTVVVSERRSAFTWDDIVAHAVGGDAGRIALRKSSDLEEFNIQATNALERLLEELGAVPPEIMGEAVELVHGEWWEGVSAVRRQLDIGLDDGTVRPWLVRGVDACDYVDPLQPEPYPVPPLRDSLRPDGRSLASIEIEMRVFEANRIRMTIPGQPRRIVPYRDFPHIMEGIREDLADQYGWHVDRPHDQ